MAKVTKRGDELQSKKLELLEDITSTVREIYKIKGPIKDVRTVIDVLGGKVIENSQTDNMDILVCQNGVQIVIPGYTAREQKNMHLAKGIGYIYLYSNYMANNKKYDVNDAMKMQMATLSTGKIKIMPTVRYLFSVIHLSLERSGSTRVEKFYLISSTQRPVSRRRPLALKGQYILYMPEKISRMIKEYLSGIKMKRLWMRQQIKMESRLLSIIK